MISDPELKLLVDLCASAIRHEPCEPVGKGHDWPRLVRLARRHRVEGLAWLGLTGGTGSTLPAAADLFDDSRSIAERNLRAAAAAGRLLGEFRNENLALLFFKGLTLGALVYPNAMLKMSTDIDILVDPGEIDAAEGCLVRLGYEPAGQRRSRSGRAASAKEWTWTASDGLVVDLHVRLADNAALLPGIDARSPGKLVEVAPGIALPTLKAEQLFAYLCVHGASSAWFRLKWAADLAAFLHRFDADRIRELYSASQSLGAGRCPDLALLVVEELFGPLIPDDLLSSARKDRLAGLLARLSLRELAQMREPLERPLGTVGIHLTELFMGRGVSFPLREFRRQFANLVA